MCSLSLGELEAVVVFALARNRASLGWRGQLRLTFPVCTNPPRWVSWPSVQSTQRKLHDSARVAAAGAQRPEPGHAVLSACGGARDGPQADSIRLLRPVLKSPTLNPERAHPPLGGGPNGAQSRRHIRSSLELLDHAAADLLLHPPHTKPHSAGSYLNLGWAPPQESAVSQSLVRILISASIFQPPWPITYPGTTNLPQARWLR